MADSYKVGEAPWEKGNAKPAGFKVGEAPWEKELQAHAKENYGAADPGSPLSQLANDAGEKIANGLGRAGNFIPGLGAIVGAQAMGMLPNPNNGYKPIGQVVTKDDIKNAFVGKGPEYGEYTKRMGFQPTMSADIPGVGTVTDKGVIDKVTGLALDPTVLQSLARGAMGVRNLATGYVAPEVAAAKNMGQDVSAWSKLRGKDAMLTNNSVEASDAIAKGLAAPRTRLSQAADALGNLNHEAPPLISERMQNTGKNMHASAFKNVDQRLLDEGVGPVSPIAWKDPQRRMDGRMTTIEDGANSILNDRNRQQQDVIIRGERLGVDIDPVKSAQPAFRDLDAMKARSNFTDGDKIEKIKQWIKDKSFLPDPEKLKIAQAQQAAAEAENASMMLSPNRVPVPLPEVPVERVPLRKAVTTKTDLRKAIGENSMDTHGYLASADKQAGKSLANGYQGQIVDELNSAQHGLGDEMAGIGKDQQSLIEAQDHLAREARGEVRKNGVTAIDGALMHNPKMAIPKKIVELGNGAFARTRGGRLIHDMGSSRVMTPIDMMSSDPWTRELMKENYEDQPAKSAWQTLKGK